MNKGRLAVYEWNAWELFAICEWRLDAYRIKAHPDDEVQDVLARLRPDTSDFLVHLNLSRQALFPRQRSELFEALEKKGIRTWNANVNDMTKRFVQSECQRLGLPTTAATRDGDPEEKLILKSDCNHGGRNERRLDLETRRRLGLPPESAVIDGSLDYPVMKRSELTDQWDDPGLVAERLIENSQGVYYRAYAIEGRLVISRFVPPNPEHPIQRIEGAKARRNFLYEDYTSFVGASESDDALPARLKSVVASFLIGIPLDFGALDVVEDNEGNFYIIDLNITPYWGVPGQPKMTRFLRQEPSLREKLSKRIVGWIPSCCSKDKREI
ncbi:hypothetical protein [Rhodopirellula sp. P2]|uniref:hypothetical protein n=1 Tax=Rhodopirellula sp. P2 TaxID=2127060 RepID=UPI002367E137|nr:hypothetical protein [Rhodopirellula sp. P2]WDQ17786.1 hypothetical protein PSR62_04355 [Rhodopirellula sp. P2]